MDMQLTFFRRSRSGQSDLDSGIKDETETDPVERAFWQPWHNKSNMGLQHKMDNFIKKKESNSMVINGNILCSILDYYTALLLLLL